MYDSQENRAAAPPKRDWSFARKAAVFVLVLVVASGAALVYELRSGSKMTAIAGPMVVDGEVKGENGRVIENVRITSEDGPCLVLRNVENITIRNSEIGPCGGNGIEIETSKNIRILDSYVHAEFPVHGCCDKGNSIFAVLSSDIHIQGNVVAYGETNVQLLGVSDVQVVGNFLLNPLGPFPRGQQIQVWGRGPTRSSNILVEDNYALASTDPEYVFPEAQWDAINFGYTDGAIVRNNYVAGGLSPSGCGIIADDSANDMQFLNNTLLNTGQCGIGIASGLNHVVDGNRIFNTGLTLPNVGNTAVYVWDQYQAGCGPVQVTNNVAVMRQPNGSFNSYWKGSGCDTTTLSDNVFDEAALQILSPTNDVLTPPSIPPKVFAKKPATPFSSPD